MDVTPDLLGAFPLLKPLPNELLTELAVMCTAEKFSRRGIVIDPEASADSICFLFEGRLQGVDFTIDGREVGLFFVEPGDFCGEIVLFDEISQSNYVIALSQSLVVKVPCSKLKSIMLEFPSVMNTLGNKLASRVRYLTFQRSLLAIPNIQQRVCCQLWMLCKDSRHDAQPGSEAEIANPPTHLEIANMLSISRESVTRVFQTLQNRQIVKRNGPSSLIITHPNKLKALAEDSDGSGDT